LGREGLCIARTCSEIAADVTGCYVSQQCQNALASFESHASKRYKKVRNERKFNLMLKFGENLKKKWFFIETNLLE
jgi:hypothetical protein